MGGKHYSKDLEKFVEGVVNGEGLESLSYWLEVLLQGQPEVAKYTPPTYILGIGTFLQIKRMHYLQAALDGSRVTGQIVTFYKREVDACLEGLRDALKAFERFRDSTMQNDLSFYVPEGENVKKIFNKIYLGQDSTAKVSGAIASLDNISKALQTDIAGPITHFWKLQWSTLS